MPWMVVHLRTQPVFCLKDISPRKHGRTWDKMVMIPTEFTVSSESLIMAGIWDLRFVLFLMNASKLAGSLKVTGGWGFHQILDGSSLQRASSTSATDVLFHHHDVRWSHLKGWVLAWNDVAVAQTTMVQAGSSCGTSIFFKESFPGWCFFSSHFCVSSNGRFGEWWEWDVCYSRGQALWSPQMMWSWNDHGHLGPSKSACEFFFFRWTPQIIYPLVI